MGHAQVLEGGCRCSRLRFRLTAPPLIEGLCHCTGCQRMTASAFSTTISVPVQGFEVVTGETEIGGIHGDEAHHHHCVWCKSWVFTRVDPSMGFVNVRATLLDDRSVFTPYIEMQVAEKLRWVETKVERRYDRFPELEEYPQLIADYAAWRAVR
ncbi:MULTISPECIES: GFA family protein [Novosphingobium]|jgi:hypothetical protein|uniref:Glutathione-dependent formaldehyde-activating, GFA n=1 Tax=Novosphingobium resinovorum TaxID=158500 RepID=A0A031K634_9SPHN|nr:GFA family protein [Novosphingobium resinovorum]EZP84684.1 Glutathione-dependent formaldehyde-activating, GFA [Novosphingobium resinovorum]GLK42485.1 aldehyde-activating protein [Novosphingobium resinovorum]